MASVETSRSTGRLRLFIGSAPPVYWLSPIIVGRRCGQVLAQWGTRSTASVSTAGLVMAVLTCLRAGIRCHPTALGSSTLSHDQARSFTAACVRCIPFLRARPGFTQVSPEMPVVINLREILGKTFLVCLLNQVRCGASKRSTHLYSVPVMAAKGR